MFVDPDKPLPLDEEKKDGLGSVLNAIIEINNLRTNLQGTVEEFESKIELEKEESFDKIAAYAAEVEAALRAHEDREGAVHGETKETAGLGLKNNWRTGNINEHELGQANNVYATSAGIKKLVEKRLRITPEAYIRSRIMPIASGGQLGTIPQTAFNWKEGEVVESPMDPMAFYTDTPWQFLTDQGCQIYPAMNGSDILTQHVADPGRSKRASTAFGGSAVHIYKSVLDIRRTRPSHLYAESDLEPNNEILKGSDHLFDKHAVYCMEGSKVVVRGFNKNRLPFDTLDNTTTTKNWSGIIESRENVIYNIYTHMERGNIGGFGDDIYLVIETDMWSFIENGLDCKEGPGRPAEATAKLDKKINTINYSVPAGGKIRILPRAGKPNALCVKLKDLIGFDNGQTESLWDNFDTEKATRIAFAWRSRLRGSYALRIPVGFYSADRSSYTNYYFDLGVIMKEDVATSTASATVTSLRDIAVVNQKLTPNLIPDVAGKFVRYPSSVDNQVFNPLIFNGIFDSQGGHIKTYTLYNRQYVGYYQHDVKSTLNWITNGETIQPTLTKYMYGQMSTLNNDGMYGDHLRHIPIGVNNGVTDYLTQTRDWLQNYRWGITRVETDKVPQPQTPTGHNIGPWRLGTDWIEPTDGFVPSFLIVNAEENNAFDTNCLVFNTQNEFKGYARYSYNPTNIDVPIEWLDPVALDELITTYISKLKPDWVENHKQFFYYKGRVYFFNQCVKLEELGSEEFDCYYGWIDSAFIDTASDGTKTLKINGDIASKIVVKPLKVNSRETLGIDQEGIFGLDKFESTDVYMMLMSQVGQEQKYKLMVNLAPFNNFYFEFDLTINSATLTTDVVVSESTKDPVFPYNGITGFNVDYHKIIAYGTKVPHRLHVNFQTPVMLKKAMWSFRKTPGEYGIFAQSIGTVVVTAGLMNSIAGTPIYPVGSVITVGGSNIPVRSPVSARDSSFGTGDELYARLNGGGQHASKAIELFGVKYNPNGFDIEPNSGVVPCGFISDSTFYHYDPNGWRNGLLPVLDSKRMNFYGYGSSFPAFMGIYGAGLPINRFFLVSNPTVLSWNTAVGRSVPVGGGSNVKITVNDVAQTYNNSGTYVIPAAFTGVVTIKITGNRGITWGPGLTNIVTIGNTVTKLDFSGSSQFTISSLLPDRVTSFANLFKGATAASYPGLELWNTSRITDMSGCFSGAVNFTQDLSTWNTSSVIAMNEMFKGATKYNSPIGNWNVARVIDMSQMFSSALAFNQSLSAWNTGDVRNFSYMFYGAIIFDGNISTWDVSSGSNFSSMFEEAVAFNGNLASWDTVSATNMNKMFKRAGKFNSQLNSWNVSGVTNMGEMFIDALAFSRPLNLWNTGNVTTMFEMFRRLPLFGANGDFDLSGWNMSKVTEATRMFANTNFNCKVDNWKFARGCWIHEMFLDCPKFNQDVSSWNVSGVFDMAGVFRGTLAFNKNIVGWDCTSAVGMANLFNSSSFSGDLIGWKINPNPATPINMTSVFRGARNFNGPGIKTWNVGGVGAMNSMFFDARSFNQDLSGWDVRNVVTHPEFDVAATSWTLPRPNFVR